MRDIHNKKYTVAFAKAFNHLNISFIENLLSEDFCFASQKVLEEFTSKQTYINYLKPKFKTILESEAKVVARLAVYNNNYCVVLYQIDMKRIKPTEVATLLIEVFDDKIKRANLCVVPTINELELLLEFPA